MIEVTGDLWTTPADAKCVTTNGIYTGPKRHPHAVMGAGCAAQARERYPQLEHDLGRGLQKDGNHVFLFGYGDDNDLDILITFPTKHHWRDPADLDLIAQSCDELMALQVPGTVLLPRPGVGFGGLQWDEVRPILADRLNDQIHVITWEQHAHASS